MNYFFVKFFSSDWIKIWSKNIYSLIHCLRCPFLRMSKCQNFSPFVKIRNYFEGFWNFSTSISWKNPSNFTIYPSDLRIINWFFVYLFQFLLQLFFPNLLCHISIIKTQNIKNVDFLYVGRCLEILLRSDELNVLLLSLLILSSFQWYFSFSALNLSLSFCLDDFFNVWNSFVSFLLFCQKLSFSSVLRWSFCSFSDSHLISSMYQQSLK